MRHHAASSGIKLESMATSPCAEFAYRTELVPIRDLLFALSRVRNYKPLYAPNARRQYCRIALHNSGAALRTKERQHESACL